MPTKKQLQEINGNLMKGQHCIEDVIVQMEDFLQGFLRDGLTWKEENCPGCKIARNADLLTNIIIDLIDKNEELKKEIKQLKDN